MLGKVFLPLEERRAAASPHDWPGDFAHENGNYECVCCECGERFLGHKRRIVCRACVKPIGMTNG